MYRTISPSGINKAHYESEPYDEMNPKGIREMTFGLEIRTAIEMRGAHEDTRGARGDESQRDS